MSIPAARVTVLIVDDDPVIRDLLVRRVGQAGYGVATAQTRAEVMAALDAGSCGAIVLDLGLPGDDGIAIAKAVRQRSAIPILMLTGRAGVKSRVEGLEAGADDYLVKPFAPEELAARLRAILRRVPAAVKPVRAIGLGSARLDCASGDIVGPLGRTRLTSRETSLLLALVLGTGPLSRPAACRMILGRDWDPLDRSLDVHVANLRRKLETVCDDSSIIVTVRGKGYQLGVPGRVEAD